MSGCECKPDRAQPSIEGWYLIGTIRREVFQVRALIGEEFNDWSDSVTQICK